MVGEDADLGAFRRAWLEVQDGLTGRHYAEALEAAGEIDAALEVCERMWELGFPAGYTDAAWIEHDRGNVGRAVQLMTAAAEVLDGDEGAEAEGVAGHWRWEHWNDVSAETMLRSGMRAYPSARTDLAALLRVTGRGPEGLAVLRDGVDAGEVVCMLPLGNVLSEQGDVAGAEALYRRAADLGDAYAAWNLAVVLAEQGRHDEADEWAWRAAAAGDEVAIEHLSGRVTRDPASDD
jgi:tetratricopeptide (TPR) repeat protein